MPTGGPQRAVTGCPAGGGPDRLLGRQWYRVARSWSVRQARILVKIAAPEYQRGLIAYGPAGLDAVAVNP